MTKPKKRPSKPGDTRSRLDSDVGSGQPLVAPNVPESPAVSAPAISESPSPEPSQPQRRPIRTTLLVLGSVLAILFAAVAVWTIMLYGALTGSASKTSPTMTQLRKALSAQQPNQPTRILVVGVDKARIAGATRSDTMILVQLDWSSRQVWIVSIPRDTRIYLQGHGFLKVNGAHEIGGPALTVSAVRSLLGLPINHYVEVDWAGFERLVDDLGGVWVNIPSPIHDRKAASHTLHSRARAVPSGYQHLDGAHALTFARSRKFIDADFSRMRDQQTLLRALASQAARPRNVVLAPRIIGDLFKQVITDLGRGDMVSIALLANLAGSGGVHTTTLTGDWRSPFVYANPTALAAIQRALRTDTDFNTNLTDPALTVSNGSGIAGAGAAITRRLQQQGLRVKRLGNAPRRFDHTVVVYKGNDPSIAERVARLLGGAQVASAGSYYRFSTQILVVVGNDWSNLSTRNARERP